MKTISSNLPVARHSIVKDRACRALLGALAILAGVGFGASPANATDYKFYPPAAGGTIKIGLKAFPNSVCEFLEVRILAGDTAEQKATKIKNAINNGCVGIFSATVDGDTVSVKDTANPNRKVFIHIKEDDTGESDQIKKDAESHWWTLWTDGKWYEPEGSSVGISRDGERPGMLSVGTSRYVARIPTSPDIPLRDQLLMAQFDLHMHGVENVQLVDLPNGRTALRIEPTAEDEFVEFGVDDLGLTNGFREPFDPSLGCIDVIRDGTVNLLDLATLLANFGATDANPEHGDVDFDGDIDLDDLTQLLSAFGSRCP